MEKLTQSNRYFSSSFAAGNRLSEQSAAASAITRSQLWILAGFASLIIGAPILAWTLGDGEKSQAQKTYVTLQYLVFMFFCCSVKEDCLFRRLFLRSITLQVFEVEVEVGLI